MPDIVTAVSISKQANGPEGKLTLLENISLRIHAGESVAITGTSGAGKSTLLGILAGLDAASSGRVELNGVNISELDEDGRAQIRAEQVGFVFQSFHLLPSLTALENVMLPLELANRPDAEKSASEVLDRVGLGARLRHYPNQLSGGEQQRVAIARAFVMNPVVLFADEPTGNLDQHTGQQIIDLLFKLNGEHGTTLILVTHDRDLSSRCDREIRLDSGRIVS
jgi:putative ABC transport system ATP-binding protein